MKVVFALTIISVDDKLIKDKHPEDSDACWAAAMFLKIINVVYIFSQNYKKDTCV